MKGSNNHTSYKGCSRPTQAERDGYIATISKNWSTLYTEWMPDTHAPSNVREGRLELLEPKDWASPLLAALETLSSMTTDNSARAFQAVQTAYLRRRAKEVQDKIRGPFKYSSADVEDAIRMLQASGDAKGSHVVCADTLAGVGTAGILKDSSTHQMNGTSVHNQASDPNVATQVTLSSSTTATMQTPPVPAPIAKMQALPTLAPIATMQTPPVLAPIAKMQDLPTLAPIAKMQALPAQMPTMPTRDVHTTNQTWTGLSQAHVPTNSTSTPDTQGRCPPLAPGSLKRSRDQAGDEQILSPAAEQDGWSPMKRMRIGSIDQIMGEGAALPTDSIDQVMSVDAAPPNSSIDQVMGEDAALPRAADGREMKVERDPVTTVSQHQAVRPPQHAPNPTANAPHAPNKQYSSRRRNNRRAPTISLWIRIPDYETARSLEPIFGQQHGYRDHHFVPRRNFCFVEIAGKACAQAALAELRFYLRDAGLDAVVRVEIANESRHLMEGVA